MIQMRLAIAASAALVLLGAINADGQLVNRLGRTDHIVIVAKSGPGYRSIQAALDSIVDAGADNPYLIYVAPGVYEEQVDMKSYVDIEGAGQGLTKIISGGDYAISGASHAELRSLTLEGAASCERVLWTGFGDSMTVSDVTVSASEGEAIDLWYAGPTVLKNVRIENGSGIGIRLVRSTAILGGVSILTTGSFGIVAFYPEAVLEIRNSVIVAEGPGSQGILGYGVTYLDQVTVLGEACGITVGSLGSMTVRHSEVGGGICNYGVATLVHSQFDGSVMGDAGASCFCVHDADLNLLDGDCQSPSH